MMKMTLRRIEKERISEHCCHIEYQLRDSLKWWSSISKASFFVTFLLLFIRKAFCDTFICNNKSVF